MKARKGMLSVADERELMKNDAAARWLERQAKAPLKSKKKKARKS